MARFSLPPREIPTSGDDSPAQSLVRYVWRMSGRHQILVCLLALAVAALTMVPLELQRRIINGALEMKQFEPLITLGAIYLGVLIVQALLKYLLRLYQSWLSESAILYNRSHLARLHDQHLADERDEENGRAVSIIGAEIDRLGGFVGEGFSQPVVNLGMLLAIGGYMLVVEPMVAAVSLLVLVPQVILVPIIQHKLNELIERRLDLLRSMSDSISELHGEGKDAEEIALLPQLRDIYHNRVAIYAVKFLMKGLINLLNNLAPLVVLMVGGYMVIQGESTVGVVVAFISGVQRLVDPVRELMNYYRVAAQANVQHSMIARWM